MAEQVPVNKYSGFDQFLSHLVFENQSLRIGLEVSGCVLVHILLSTLVPWEAMGIAIQTGSLLSWFFCCTLVLVIDQLFLCKSAYALRRAYLLSLSGEYESALELYESIGPFGDSRVRMPTELYHLHRAELLTRCGDLYLAEREFGLAEDAGADESHLAVARSRYYLAKDDPEQARLVIENAKEVLGDTPILLLEEGKQLVDTKTDLWHAKKIFREVLKLPNEPHYSGENCHQLAMAYISVCRLWTGEAEIGIEQLSDSINRLQSQSGFVDTLRPLLAEFLSYRAHYYATHKSPKEGVIDLKVALSLCSYPHLLEKIEKTKEELSWRHGIELS
jgi:hypothetical protein